jgi:hypothetical protein
MAIEIIKTDSLQLLSIGGVATANSDNNIIYKLTGKKLSGNVRNVYLLSNHLDKAISGKLIKAMLYHEEGHIVYNHRVFFTKLYRRNKNGILVFDSKAAELQADAYAAKNTDPQTVIQALNAIIEYIGTSDAIINNLSSKMTLEAAQLQVNIYSKKLSKVLEYRIEALQKLI